MKLNEKALEAAAQAAWESKGSFGNFRERSAYPEHWVEAASSAVLAYLEALDAEGLADLYEYWCERIEALPKKKVEVGDTYATRTGLGWKVVTARATVPLVVNERILRYGSTRQWEIGDLVDETRDLPDGAIVRDEDGDIAVHDGGGNFSAAGLAGARHLGHLNEPRIIWLPEDGDES